MPDKKYFDPIESSNSAGLDLSNFVTRDLENGRYDSAEQVVKLFQLNYIRILDQHVNRGEITADRAYEAQKRFLLGPFSSLMAIIGEARIRDSKRKNI